MKNVKMRLVISGKNVLFGAVILGLLTSTSAAWAQSAQDIVQRNRDKYGATVSPQEAPVLLHAIAADLTQTLGQQYGLLPKTSGNNCGGYACDIICNTGFHWDVFINGPDALMNMPGTSNAAWQPKGSVPNACELVGAVVSMPPPIYTPPVPTVDLMQAILNAIADVRAAQERIYIDETNQHTNQVVNLKASIDNPGWFSTIFGNKYTQMVLAAVGTCAATTCWSPKK